MERLQKSNSERLYYVISKLIIFIYNSKYLHLVPKIKIGSVPTKNVTQQELLEIKINFQRISKNKNSKDKFRNHNLF